MIPTSPPPLLFPLSSDGRSITSGYLSISYPYRTPTFSSLAAGLICTLVPLVTIVLVQVWSHGSFRWHRRQQQQGLRQPHPSRPVHIFAHSAFGVVGLLSAIVTGTWIQVILKKFVGGLRPHFLDVCRPVVSGPGQGAGGLWYTSQVCTGDSKLVANALQSFPSGHSEIAFAGLGYLAIYLFAHLRSRRQQDQTGPSEDAENVIGGHHPMATSSLPMLTVVVPLLLATYIPCTLVIGYQHHVGDCLFGAAIGATVAILAYRTTYASLTDPATNSTPRVGRPRLENAMQEEKDRDALVFVPDPAPDLEKLE